jgi:hypothetical protein
MGLLEDAIREHLELKRLRGADPGEVAREQHEALDPPTVARPAPGVEDHAVAAQTGAETAPSQAAELPADQEAPDQLNSTAAAPPHHAAQETAEIDMQAVLGDDQAIGTEEAPRESSQTPDAADSPPPSGEEESLEWEIPKGSSRKPEGHATPDNEAPDQGRLSL